MPSSDAIVASMTAMATEWRTVAIGWHLVLALTAIAFLWLASVEPHRLVRAGSAAAVCERGGLGLGQSMQRNDLRSSRRVTESWGMRPGHPARRQAFFQAFVNDVMGRGFASARPPRFPTIRKNTHGTICPVALRRRSCSSSTLRSSNVITNVRPSPFFVVPVSSVTSPLSKSTCRHCSGNTSDFIRQPVM